LTLELAQIVAGWPLATSLAAAVGVRGLQGGRRRAALNEALHELRRPLQALVLTVPGEAAGAESSVQMAAVALERLEREINGTAVAAPALPIAVEPLLRAALDAWRPRAALAGSSIELRWRAGEAIVVGDRCDLAQALDNLLANAIEHGGPAIVVEARPVGGRLRLAVADHGRAEAPRSRRGGAAVVLARARGRHRHGHGLRVVRKAASALGGRFELRRGRRGCEAVLILPLLGEGAA